MDDDVVVVDAIRLASGRGKPGGALSGTHPVDLSAAILENLLLRNGLESRVVDDVLWGTVSQVGEQSTNIARNAVLAAGFDERVPATTIDRQCGSSQQAVHFAAQGILAGSYDVVIAGGAESMSRVPLGKASESGSPISPRMSQRYPDGLVNQGVAAELVAQRWGLDRAALDAFSAASHHRAAQARDAGLFDREILPIESPEDAGADPHRRDETIRDQTTVESLAGLQSAFRTDAYAERFPDVGWHITAGSSSPFTDGASGVLLMSARRAAELGLRPRARIHAMTVIGDDPLLMLTGPIEASRRLFRSTGLGIGDMDAYEVNEAFASVPLAWMKEVDADPDRLNPRGGAIALGHALGSSGTRLLTTLLHHLEDTGGRYGLQAICEGGGMANALILERL